MPKALTPEAIIEKGVLALLECAAEMPFEQVTLTDIASRADLTLAQFYGVADKTTLADRVEAYFDKSMSAEAADMDDTPRERLFDVIMRRFEAMEEYRDGLLSLLSWRDGQPVRLAVLLKARSKSADWALACSALDTGPRPLLRTGAVAWATARAERAWRKETSADFARTMSTLDRELRDADKRLKRVTGQGWGAHDTAAS